MIIKFFRKVFINKDYYKQNFFYKIAKSQNNNKENIFLKRFQKS